MDNYDEIKQLREAWREEYAYLRSLSVDDVEMRRAVIDNLVRISDQIEALDR